MEEKYVRNSWIHWKRRSSTDFCWMVCQSWSTEAMILPGLRIFDGEKINVAKTKGRLKALSELTHDGILLPGTLGIGHTRWATHGSPSDTNAHPHLNTEETIVVVHNGIIENYIKLKNEVGGQRIPVCI